MRRVICTASRDRPSPGPSSYAIEIESDIPLPTPGVGEVLVRVEHCGLNPVDFKLADGVEENGDRSSHAPARRVLGLDPCGTVTKAGDGGEHLIGKRVYAHLNLQRPLDGGLAQFVVVPVAVVAEVREELSSSQVASVPCAGFTALQAMDSAFSVLTSVLFSSDPKEGGPMSSTMKTLDALFDSSPDDHRGGDHPTSPKALLVTGGAGGVGSFVLQLARALNKAAGRTLISPIVASCGSDESDAYCRRMGATACVRYNTETYVDDANALTGGRGFHVLIDTVSGESVVSLISAVRAHGTIIPIGMPPFPTDFLNATQLFQLFQASISLQFLSLGLTAYGSGDEGLRYLQHLGIRMDRLYKEGLLNPEDLEHEVLPSLEETASGLERLRSRRVRGKLVVKVD